MKGLDELAKSASLVFAGTVLGQVLGLLGELLAIRSVTPDVLGGLGLAYAIVSTLGTIVLFGVPSGVTRLLSASDNQEYKQNVLIAGYGITLLSATVLALILYVFRTDISSLAGGTEIAGLLPLFLPYLLVLPVARISFSALRANQLTIPATVSKWIGPRVVALAILGFFIFVWNRPEPGIIAYWVGIPIFASIFSLWFLIRRLNWSTPTVPKRDNITDLWRFSWPLAISVSLTMMLTRLDILMLGIFVDATSIGYYRSIQPLRQITTFVTGAFGFLFLPLATQYYETGNLDELNQLYVTSTKWITMLTLPFVLVFSVFSRDIIRVFFGAQYTPAAPALTILIAGLFFRALVGLDTDLLKAIDRTKIELGCALVGVVTNVVLNFLFIPLYGIVGAAVATVSGFFIYNLCEVFVIYRTTGIHPFGRNNLKPILPTTIVGIGLWYLIDSSGFGLFGLILLGVIISIAHLAVLIGTRSLSENDLFLIEKIESKFDRDLSSIKSFITEF